MTKSGLEPKIKRIKQLITSVKKGEIKIPKFQRSFVWKRNDILILLDSIYRGYPIGSILLWETEQKLASERQIGDLIIDKPDHNRDVCQYLLDGQQRLSTLAGVLHWNGENPKSQWNVWFDLEEESFLYLDHSPENKHFPLRKLLGCSGVEFRNQLAAFDDSPHKELFEKNLNSLMDTFTDYELPVIMIGEMTIEEVTPIFERINSTGRPLDITDLMRAATWTEEFDLTNAVSEIQTALKPKGFGAITELEILQSISASKREGFDKEDINSLRNLPQSELKSCFLETQSSFLLSVDFISSELKIYSTKLIPYNRQLTLITEFFRICRHPSYEQRQCLKQWFWYTTFSNYFTSISYGGLREALAKIRSLAKGEIKSIKEFEFTKILEIRELQKQFSSKKAFTRGFALMLLGNHPCSLTNGAIVDYAALSRVNIPERHHIFPKSFLKKNRISEPSPNAHVNYCLLPKLENINISDRSPSDYLTEIIDKLGENNAYDVFESNLLDRKCISACLSDNYEEFIRHRSALLSEKIKVLAGF